jgi:ferric-dicitrate binding protein FerR (iron transport regulator)
LLTEPERWSFDSAERHPSALQTGSRVELTDESQVVIPVSDTDFLVIQGPARFEVGRLNRHRITGKLQADLLLHEGELLLQASSIHPKAIQIQTPLVTVRVTGTKLLVGHREPQGSRVGVVEGKVLAKPLGVWQAWEPVEAGQAFKITPEGTVYREEFGGSRVRSQEFGVRTEAEQPMEPMADQPEAPPDLWRWLWREQE